MKKGTTGIYKISAIGKDLLYIGSSVKCIKSRIYYHKRDLRANKHHSSKLQNYFNKYGEGSLKFELLEEVIDSSLILNKEQYYIDTLVPFFNICKIAGNCAGRKFSEETKLKMSIKAKERGANCFLKAQQQSPYPAETETEKYCSKHKCYHSKDNFVKNKGNICKEWINSNRRSRSIAGARREHALRRAHPIVATNKTESIKFESLHDCIRKLSVIFPKINRFNIKKSIENSKTYYGYTWSYTNGTH